FHQRHDLPAQLRLLLAQRGDLLLQLGLVRLRLLQAFFDQGQPLLGNSNRGVLLEQVSQPPHDDSLRGQQVPRERANTTGVYGHPRRAPRGHQRSVGVPCFLAFLLAALLASSACQCSMCWVRMRSRSFTHSTSRRSRSFSATSSSTLANSS